MREIVLDTETTGLDPFDGHRVVEIGCVELLNRIPTGAVFHVYLNPQRSMPEEAFRVHGLSGEFLSDKPCFADVAADFMNFVGEAKLVIHNAAFDIGFLNAELDRTGAGKIERDRIVDTLQLARRRNPGGTNSLDALCNRYGIDLGRRVKHGALLDAELLAEVYLELLGGRQATLGLGAVVAPRLGMAAIRVVRTRPMPLMPRLLEADLAAHAGFVASLGKAIWLDYAEPEAPVVLVTGDPIRPTLALAAAPA
jgi:DNA polymerase-3 subunit epsilon